MDADGNLRIEGRDEFPLTASGKIREDVLRQSRTTG